MAAVDVVIRRYRESDREAVETFKCVTPGERHWTKPPEQCIRGAPADISDGADAGLFVGEESPSGRIVGIIVFGPDLNVEGQYRIHAMGVVRDRRREGIATSLKYAALTEIAATAGHQSVFSDVHKNNVAMIGLNDKLGAKKELDPDHPAHFLSVVEVEIEDS